MKPVLSVLLIFIVVIIAIHHSSASMRGINRRYYDSWNSNNDVSGNSNDELTKIFRVHQKSIEKDICANKPLWYLKNHARLGKLSPFYSCLERYGL